MFVYFDWYVKSPGGHNASLKYCTLFSNTLPETFMRLELKKIKKVKKKKKKKKPSCNNEVIHFVYFLMKFQTCVN